MYTAAFWKDALERAIKTIAQTTVALLTASAGLGILDINWPTIFSVAVLAGIVSILTSVGAANTGTEATPQFGVSTYIAG